LESLVDYISYLLKLSGRMRWTGLKACMGAGEANKKSEGKRILNAF
jgi:hypothetical protein